MSDDGSRWNVSRRAAEIGFSLFTLGVGFVIALGASELDYGWARSGPEAGYFPMRVGWLLIGASALVLLRSVLDRSMPVTFQTGRTAASIAWFVAPLVLLVALVPWLGMYVAIALYLVVALAIVGSVAWPTTLAVAALSPLFLFVLFEYVFLVPLPKGLLGALLGIR